MIGLEGGLCAVLDFADAVAGVSAGVVAAGSLTLMRGGLLNRAASLLSFSENFRGFRKIFAFPTTLKKILTSSYTPW